MNELDIFSQALDVPDPADRERYLDMVCGECSELRNRIASLLRNAAEVSQFLERPALDQTDNKSGHSTPACGPADEGERTEAVPLAKIVNLDFLMPSGDETVLGDIGPYGVTEVIGRGGMGIVLKARDKSLNRVVAVKVMAPELSGNPMARSRFLREARAAAAVVHQNIVTIHAVAEDTSCSQHGPLPYLVMECVEGQSLQEKLDIAGHLDVKETLRIGAQIAAGLAAAHAQGVMHRDIKPSNILLENGIERVRITDFGLARAVDDVEITRLGEVAGTPQYMSPEQAQGLPMDARSDLFSLGCVLYAMGTGRSPFRAERTIDAIRRVCDDTPQPIREINPDVPEQLNSIIARLLAKQVEDRIQTASEVADLLNRQLAQLQAPDSTSPPALLPPTERGQKKSLAHLRGWVALAVVLVVIAALGGTEAAGVTRLVGTMIRIVTGEGTLLIELNDPTVGISLDGEELSLNGGGVKELRLRPGQYQFLATRDGQPVKQELVTITRGGERIVTVSREPFPGDRRSQMPPRTIPQEENGQHTSSDAFVVLGSEDAPEQKFATLAEAVLAARDGDTIEIRGNGPFVTDPLAVNHALTVSAGYGFRPLIQLDPEVDGKALVLLRANAPLALEGIEFHRTIPNDAGDWQAIIQSTEKLALLNCRLLAASHRDCLWSKRSLTLRNCELLVSNPHNMNPFSWDPGPGGQAVIENCVLMGPILCRYKGGPVESQAGSIRFQCNTLVALDGLRMDLIERPPDAKTEQAAVAINVYSSQNIFDLRRSMLMFNQELMEPFEAMKTEGLLRRFLNWRDERNLYHSGSSLCVFGLMHKPVGVSKDLGEWNRFWGLKETGTSQNTIRFQGGDLFAKSQTAMQQLTRENFRLHSDSAGVRAGPDGKDLGADIDLVGPGEAYERWKKTPEYKEWLKETESVK